MKTLVSIPDDIFAGAERLARRTKRSRSRLFSDALREYLNRHAPHKVTPAIDRALAQIAGDKDPCMAASAAQTLKRSEW